MTVTEPRIAVTSEPMTYEYGNGRSFFLDMIRASRFGDTTAQQRLYRHQHEFEIETRTTPNTTATTGGEFAPPLWAIDQFTTQARAGRVLADLVTKMVLPPGVSSVHTPKMTTGADAPIQTAQNLPVQDTDEVTADAQSSVVTISGEEDAAIQLLDMTPPPGYDGIVYTDLSRGYNQNLEKQCLAGTGTNGQLTGVQNVASRVSDVSGAGISTTQATGFPQLWVALGQIAAGVSNARLLPPEIYLLAPRRWFWLASAVDTATRPIGQVGSYAVGSDFPIAPGNAKANAVALGAGMPFTVNGIPAYMDGAIPAGTSADVAIALRCSDMLLYESAPKFAVINEPGSGTLSVRLQLRRYVAFVNTKPSSICVLTGIPAPTGF